MPIYVCTLNGCYYQGYLAARMHTPASSCCGVVGLGNVTPISALHSTPSLHLVHLVQSLTTLDCCLCVGSVYSCCSQGVIYCRQQLGSPGKLQSRTVCCESAWLGTQTHTALCFPDRVQTVASRGGIASVSRSIPLRAWSWTAERTERQQEGRYVGSAHSHTVMYCTFRESCACTVYG